MILGLSIANFTTFFILGFMAIRKFKPLEA